MMKRMIIAPLAALAIALVAVPAASQSGALLYRGASRATLPTMGAAHVTGRTVGLFKPGMMTVAGPSGIVPVDISAAVIRLRGEPIDRAWIPRGAPVAVLGAMNGRILRAHEVRLLGE